MRALLIVLLLVAACDGASERSEDRRRAAEFATYPYRDLPPWAPLPESGVGIVRPQKWISDGRPTVFLFTASWCPPCISSLLLDITIAREYSDRFQVGIALVEESDADFTSSTMGRLVGGVPVWSADSVRDHAVRCGVWTIPFACLVDRGRVVFRGPPINARHVLEAFAADPSGLDARLAAGAQRHASAIAGLGFGVDPANVDELVEQTSTDLHWQHATAFALASQPEPSASDLVLAVALARSVVAVGGALDYWHLSTYSLALSKAGRAEDAATVSWRVLSLCRRVQSRCMTERIRANGFIYYWQETGGRGQFR